MFECILFGWTQLYIMPKINIRSIKLKWLIVNEKTYIHIRIFASAKNNTKKLLCDGFEAGKVNFEIGTEPDMKPMNLS